MPLKSPSVDYQACYKQEIVLFLQTGTKDLIEKSNVPLPEHNATDYVKMTYRLNGWLKTKKGRIP